jgi:aminoglycoside phosphotransferase (APT) family kinase protein
MKETDSTAVRAGEELDVAALAQYLCEVLAKVPSTSVSKDQLELKQFPGGHSNLTYLVRYGDREFVLRRPPLGPVAPTAHDMPREYKVLSVIHPHFPLAPKPLVLCEDSSIIGAPFYLMERRKGLIVRQRVPVEIGEDVELRRRVSAAVIDTLIASHCRCSGNRDYSNWEAGWICAASSARLGRQVEASQDRRAAGNGSCY